MADSLPPEKYKSAEYLERESEQALMMQVIKAFSALPVKGVGNPQDVYPISAAADDTHWWSMGWPKNRGGHHHDHRFHSEFAFADRRWTGQDRVDGTPQVSVGTVRPDDGWAETIDNNTTLPLTQAVAKQVELERSSVHKLTAGITTETSSETTVTGTVGGDATGGSLSVAETLKQVLGTSFGTENETSENNTESDTTSDDFTAPPFARLLITEQRRRKVTVTPWTASGVREFGPQFKLYHWVNRQSPYLKKHDDKFVSVVEFVQFWHGGDTRFASMKGFYETTTDGVRAAIDYLENTDNRTLSLQGEQRDVFEDNSELVAEELPLPGHERQYWFAYLSDESRHADEQIVPDDILAAWQAQNKGG